MDMNQIEARLSALEKELAEAKLEIARHESAQQIANLMCRYENLHSSHRWKEQEECFALKTPGVRAIFNGAVYEGADGIRSHYTGLLQEAEKNVSGRLYAHELLTPAIEVARDNQSAKAYFSSLGFETLVMPDGRRKSLWSFCKFRFGFVKEAGEWKIYRFDMHGTFNTPFDGPGWRSAFQLLSLLSGTVWGLSALLLFPAGNPALISLFILVMASRAASTTVSHASLRLSPLAWAGPALLHHGEVGFQPNQEPRLDGLVEDRPKDAALVAMKNHRDHAAGAASLTDGRSA